jgi:hypothetical protein
VATLQALRDAIKSTITANVSDVEVYDTIPDVVHTPAIVVVPAEADFNIAMGRGTDRWEFDLFVLCQRAVADEGQDQLDAYVTGAGSSSIRELVFDNKTLGVEGVDAHVSDMRGYGEAFTVAQIPHVGAILRLVVLTPGPA